MKVFQVDQGSPEWHKLRAGSITASMFSTIRDVYKTGKDKGGYKSAALDYAFRLAVERISGEPLDEGFETYQMRRGHELEPDARRWHSFVTGLPIEKAGFVSTEDGKFGASADGLIGDDGGSEYKCLIAPERLRKIVFDGDLSEFQDQVQGCLWLTGRTWWHFVLYCPALAPCGREGHMHEVQRDDDYIEALEADLLAFDAKVEEYRDMIVSAAA